MDLRSSSYEREGVLLVMKKMYLTITLTSTRIRQRVLSGHAIKICLDMAVPDTSIWTLWFFACGIWQAGGKRRISRSFG